MKQGHDDRNADPLNSIEKTRVLQDSRCFDDRQLNPSQCIPIITQLLFLLNQGEELTENEATELFFRVTKLFQSNDAQLRRMVYLILNELKPKESEAIMVTSSLMRDISNNENNFYKANAIRDLSKIIDSSLFSQVERYFQTAVVDKNDMVSSAAMMAGIRLVKQSPNAIKKWVPEVQEKLNSAYFNTHYHGLILYHEMKKNDPVGLAKFLVSMTRANIKSPLAHCQLIRFIKESFQKGRIEPHAEKPLMEYLEACLHRSQDIVVFEAAKAICESPNAQSRELTAAFTVLHLFLASTKSPVKFAAMKVLNKLASVHQQYISANLSDIEGLINDSNRSTASMAISTLLKLSAESNVERLIKQINNFMGEITDDFKVDIINSIKQLCTRMPNKYKPLLSFVSNCLKEDGGFPLKNAVVDCILDIMNEIPMAQEAGLLQLADFIEDCNYDLIQCKVLHIIGKIGPTLSKPSRLIRFIYNRLILEKPNVRAAAVSCLFKFSYIQQLTANIELLLQQCLLDKDDEVRERADFYLKSIQQNKAVEISLPASITALERTLIKCRENQQKFTWDIIDTVNQDTVEDFKSPVIETQHEEEGQDQNPIYQSLGLPQKITEPIMLTEKTAEYVITYVKLLYESHIVLQFTIENTMDDQALEDVEIQLTLDETPFDSLYDEPEGILVYSNPRIDQNSSGMVWVQMKRPESSYVGAVPASMNFKSVEYSGDQIAGSFNDEYKIEQVQFSIADYL